MVKKAPYEGDVFDADGAARFLGAHVETVRRMARRGELPAYKVGKDWRFRRDALEGWIESRPAQLSNPRILIVDDDEGVRRIFRRMLESGGYTVRAAGGGSVGLSIVAEEGIDLILLDLVMPEINGPEFIRRLRGMNRSTPVIVVSGYPDSDLVAEAMVFGPVTLIAKPLQIEVLLEAVRGALAQERIKSGQGRAPRRKAT